MDELDVPMYWLRFPGLPAHYFRLLDKVAARVGKLVRSGPTYEEMVNGSVPTVCVQIPDSAPLPSSLPLKRHGAQGMEEFDQPLHFADMMFRCDRCRHAGHTHRTCGVGGKQERVAQGQRAERSEGVQRPIRIVTMVRNDEGQTRDSAIKKESCVVLARQNGGKQELWISLDGRRRVFPMRYLREQREVDLSSKDGLALVKAETLELMMPMSRGLARSKVLQYLDGAHWYAASHDTREGGRYTYYVASIHVQEVDAATGFANRWMSCHALKEMAAAKDMRLAHSAEVIIRGLPQFPVQGRQGGSKRQRSLDSNLAGLPPPGGREGESSSGSEVGKRENGKRRRQRGSWSPEQPAVLDDHTKKRRNSPASQLETTRASQVPVGQGDRETKQPTAVRQQWEPRDSLKPSGQAVETVVPEAELTVQKMAAASGRPAAPELTPQRGCARPGDVASERLGWRSRGEYAGVSAGLSPMSPGFLGGTVVAVVSAHGCRLQQWF